MLFTYVVNVKTDKYIKLSNLSTTSHWIYKCLYLYEHLIQSFHLLKYGLLVKIRNKNRKIKIRIKYNKNKIKYIKQD